VPDLIETRPFTIHPELYAWPSFRIFSERIAWMYGILFAVIAILLKVGMAMEWVVAIPTALGVVLAALGFSFLKYRAFLGRPSTRQIYRNCIVSLTEDEVRQDFPDSSYMEIQLSAIATFREIGGFYFIFATPRHGIVVPKASFESAEESREFAEKVRGAAKARSETRGPR